MFFILLVSVIWTDVSKGLRTEQVLNIDWIFRKLSCEETLDYSGLLSTGQGWTTVANHGFPLVNCNFVQKARRRRGLWVVLFKRSRLLLTGKCHHFRSYKTIQSPLRSFCTKLQLTIGNPDELHSGQGWTDEYLILLVDLKPSDHSYFWLYLRKLYERTWGLA